MTYYFSTSDGDDSRTSVEAQSPSTPWQTLAKLNSFFASLLPGDSVLFKCGDTFYGSLNATKSGTAGSPITFGNYDSGDRPVITGFASVSAWTSLGGNLWQSTAAVSTLPTLNIVLALGNAFRPIGKWPTSGYNDIDSHTGGDNAQGTAASITSSVSLPDDFTGGEVVIRKRHWIIDRATITSQVGDTINFLNPSIYASQDGWGFFVQNHQDACSVDGDWWYDSASKKIGMYNTGGAPSDANVSNIEILLNINSQSYLTFSGLVFYGSNSAHVSVSSGHHIIFAGCELDYAGINVFSVQTAAHHISLLTCSAERINNNFINAGGSQNWTIIGNQIEDTGEVAGMGQSRDGTYIGIYNIGPGSVVQYNVIGNIGYNGIDFRGGNIQILNNIIDFFCNVKDDGAGIYTYTGPGTTVYALRTIDHNFVGDGGGASAGTNTAHEDAHGIYMDDNSSQVDITSNTVANCGSSGIFLHAAHDIRLVNNTVFNCALTTGAQFLEVFPGAVATAPVRNITNIGNKYFSKESTQKVASLKTNEANMSQWPLALTNANFNNNFYARPINEDATTMEIIRSSGTSNTDLPGWSGLSGANLDNSSNISPITVADTADIRFEVNPSSDPVTVSLGGDTYIDLAGVPYTGDITLGPWDSLILLLTDSPPDPPTDISQIIIDFTPCPTPPDEGYQILYRVVGDTAYIDAGFFTASPAIIPVDYPAGTLFEGIMRSDCGDVPWAGGGEGGGGGCEPVGLFEASPDSAFVGAPYEFSVFVGGTGPVTITPTDIPTWMTVEWVDGYIVLSGTPTEENSLANVFFTYSNCGATWDIGTFITVETCVDCTLPHDLAFPNLLSDTTEFSYRIPISGSAPFAFGTILQPAYFDIVIDGSDILITLNRPLTGADEDTGLTLSIEVTNCTAGTDTYAASFDVIAPPSFFILQRVTGITAGVSQSIDLLALPAAVTGTVYWGDGSSDTFNSGAGGPINMPHTYTYGIGEAVQIFKFDSNATGWQFSGDQFNGLPVNKWTHSAGFTGFGQTKIYQLRSYADVSLPGASALGLFYIFGHSTSPDTTIDLSGLPSTVHALGVQQWPLLTLIDNIPAAINAELNIRYNPLLTSIDDAATGTISFYNIVGCTSLPSSEVLAKTNLGLSIFIVIDGNGYTTTDVNAILVYVDSFGTSSHALQIVESGGSPPSGAGATAKANLISRSWFVSTD